MATVIGPKSQIPVVMTGGETVISRCGPLSEELKAEETHTNNNNRSRGAGGVSVQSPDGSPKIKAHR